MNASLLGRSHRAALRRKTDLASTLAFLGLMAFFAHGASAQEAAAELRASLQRGLQALEAHDYAAYAENFQRVVELMPEGDLNRPFVMYHLARARALTRDTDAAVGWLETMLDERIESLMVFYATLDPAFDSIRASIPFQRAIRRMREVQVEITLLQGSVHLLRGAGSNLAASIGPDGTLLVDTGYEPAAPGILRALGRAGAGPVRVIVATHSHEDHVGGNAALGGEALIVGHAATRAAMLEPWTFIEGVVVPPKPPEALPKLTSEGVISLHFNGEEVRVIPLPGHTKGDILVHFTGSRVLHMGDRFFPDARRHIYPGDNPQRYVETMNALLADLSPDTRVVSGHAPVVDVEALRAAHAATLEAIAWIRDGIATGRTLEQLQQEAASHDLSAGWVAGVYRALASR